MDIAKIIRNISYSLVGNLVSVLGSILMILIVPKYISVGDYGAWQLFLFYFSYVGFFHFGWEDGIYLRYAGQKYEELDHKLISGQVLGIVILQLILALLLITYSSIWIEDITKKVILYFVAIAMIFTNFNNLCSFILQITARISLYARMISVEKIVLLFTALIALIMGFQDYNALLIGKIISLISVSIIGYWGIKPLLVKNVDSIGSILKEASINIKVGSKLMLANIASMLILGIIRYGISEGWDLVTFGKISLTLSISNFLMIFITALGVVFFPILKQVDDNKLAEIYLLVRKALSVIFLGFLLAYYPLYIILDFWLPKYSDSLIYVAILFPICFFESKVTLLVNTYFKSMRKENLMLKVNIIAVLFSLILTFMSVLVFHNLTLVVLSIVLAFAFRCLLAEYFLSKILNVEVIKQVVVELLIISMFMSLSWNVISSYAFIIYSIIYLLYIYSNRFDIFHFIKLIKKA